MATRVNANILADPYSNTSSFMSPKGTIQSSNKLVPKVNQAGDPNQIRQNAIYAAANLKDKEAEVWEKQDFNTGAAANKIMANSSAIKSTVDATKNAMQAARTAKEATTALNAAKDAGTATDVLGKAAKTANAAKNASVAGAAGAGIGVAGIGAGLYGEHLINNKKEDIGGIWKGAGTGAAMGAQLGTMISPWGTLIGAGAGAIAGGVIGGLKGKKQKEDRIASEAKTASELAAYNSNMAEQRRLLKGRAGDQAKFAGIMNNSQMYNPGSGNPIVFSRKGGKLIPKFRRGGELDLQKENVILDGPSHDEHNNTGVKNDKGLAVVHKNAKVAEIESLELVLNKNASTKLEQLTDKYKRTKNKKVLDQIAELTSKEISENTYDYSKELLD